ncbi:CHAT domain-containing protein [Streptomyces aculeolatus]
MPPHPVTDDRSRLSERLRRYLDTGDPSVLLDTAAEQEAAAVLRGALRSGGDEMWAALTLTGWLYWYRATAATGPEQQREVLLALGLLGTLGEFDPAAVPEGFRHQLVESGTEREATRVGRLITYAVGVAIETGERDPAALIAAAAICRTAEAVAETPDERVRCLGNLAHAVLLLYEADGGSELLPLLIGAAQGLAQATPPGSKPHAVALGRLSHAFRLYYDVHGEPAALAEAVDHARAAVRTLPPGDPARVPRTAALVELLHLRHAHLGDTDSLREALRLSRALLAELPEGHAASASSLAALGRQLAELWDQDRSAGPAPLNEAIEVGRAAAALADTGTETDVAILAELSLWLTWRAEETGSADDLAESLTCARRAVAAATEGRVPSVASAALSASLYAQHARNSDPALLIEAIDTARAAVAAADAAQLPERRLTLGTLLNNRFTRNSDAVDGREAAACLRAAARSDRLSPLRRAHSAWYAGRLANTLEEWPQATEDLAMAIALLRDLTGPHLGARDRERLLAEFAPLPTLAASAATNAGQPERAVELLEQARGVLYADAAALHEHANRLAAVAPELAADLERTSDALRTDRDPDRRHRLAAHRNALTARIRQLPDFERFLRPPALPEILRGCAAGPVVVPLLQEGGSVALIVTVSGVSLLPLPELTATAMRQLGRDILGGAESALDAELPAARRMLGEYALSAGLALLWDAVVGPVLEELKLPADGGADGGRPKLWWCPTGPLAFLPFHAAGRHESGNALDLVTSSYTPTLRALARARPWQPTPDTKPLVVALPQTPGSAAALPAADLEAALLTTLFPGCRLLRGPAANRGAVTAALPDHEMVHLACHTGHGPDRDYESYLLLHDGKLHQSDLLPTRTSRGGLAFLSACGTALSRLDLPDESLNLLNGFHTAGFSQLIGSLWPVDDQATTRVADAFYSNLLPPARMTAAAALHAATRTLRDREPDRPSRWAAYLHVGP